MGLLSAKPSAAGRHLVLFDGFCGLCDRSVSFLARIDRHSVLYFSPLQGETAAQLRRRLAVPEHLDSMLFVADAGTPGERLLTRSSGVLAALDAVGGPWRLLSWLRVVPRPVRDAVYDFVARNRQRWFGRRETCRLPTQAERDRWLP
jgi:predicted DCC family thiol-disulfide oxidoreductase YuxK